MESRLKIFRQIGLMRAALLIALCAGAVACQTSPSRTTHAETTPGTKVRISQDRVSPEELERLNRDFADRYVMRLDGVCGVILEDNPDQAQCRQIRDMRANAAMSIYDIVTEPDPYLQTLDLTVAVTLQWIVWGEETNTQKAFGDRGKSLASAMKSSHAEVLAITCKILSPAEMETLDTLIRDWQRNNPDIRKLAYARFSSFISASDETNATREKASGLFAQIDQTRQSVDEARAFAERTLYLSKRMPLLMQWRSEATLDQFLNAPPVVQALADLHTLTTTASRLPATLDEQRKAIVQDFDQRQPAIDATVKNVDAAVKNADATVKDVRGVVAEGGTLMNDGKALLAELQKTMLAFEELMKHGDAIASRYIPAPPVPGATSMAASGPGSPSPVASAASTAPGHPFNIQEYTAAMKEASQAARDLDAALISSGKLLDSPAWRDRITELNAAADGRVHLAAEQSQLLVDAIVRRVYIALGALLVVLILARVLATWIEKRMKLRRD